MAFQNRSRGSTSCDDTNDKHYQCSINSSLVSQPKSVTGLSSSLSASTSKDGASYASGPSSPNSNPSNAHTPVSTGQSPSSNAGDEPISSHYYSQSPCSTPHERYRSGDFASGTSSYTHTTTNLSVSGSSASENGSASGTDSASGSRSDSSHGSNASASGSENGSSSVSQTGSASGTKSASETGSVSESGSASGTGSASETGSSSISGSSSGTGSASETGSGSRTGSSSGTGSASASSASTRSLITTSHRSTGDSQSSVTSGVRSSESEAAVEARQVFFVRTAERIDRIFPGFIDKYFNERDEYTPADLNLPLKLPGRVGGRSDFQKDAPITEIGSLTSQMLGRGFRKNGVNIDAVFVSPALRCVQTAAALLKLTQQKNQTLLRVEPGLYESPPSAGGLPNFLSPEQLKQAGFPIDLNYRPYVDVTTLEQTNSINRLAETIDYILKQYSSLGNIVVVGHSLTTDTCARHLLKKTASVLKPGDRVRLGVHYPYCSTVALEQNRNKEWSLVDDAVPSISYLDFTNRINGAFLVR